MQFSIILLHLAGAVMLLLWAVHMVRTCRAGLRPRFA